MRTIALLALVLASPVSAEVVTASANGFEVRQTVTVQKPPAEAFTAFGRIGSWWSADHTYSGDAANLALELRPGGCFCERLPNGGGVEHMRVAYVDPGKQVLMTGALGPLLYEATIGVMDVRFEPSGAGTQIVLDYRAAGFFNGGAEKLAPAVDKVLGEQLARLKARLPAAR